MATKKQSGATLAGALRGAIGKVVDFEWPGDDRMTGTIVDVGKDCVLVVSPPNSNGEWVIALTNLVRFKIR